MDISFIIVNYKSEKYLEKCISSIKEKVSGVDYEIIVVNNSNLEVRLPSEIGCINTGHNVGYGAGCNAGAKLAQGEILCFLNPDTEVISENIKNLLNEFEKDEKLAVIGPKLLKGKELSSFPQELSSLKTQEWIAGKEITIWSTMLNNFGYERDKRIWENMEKIECAWVSGAAMFIRKEIFNQPGGFDEKFFMYFEDIDLCKRVRNLGYKVLYYPEFVIKHFGGKSFLDKKEQKKYFYSSQDYYFKKHFNKVITDIVKLLRFIHK